MKYFLVFLRSLAAVILFQTLYFKFSGAPESVYIFSTLGVEPWGRWLAGISELVAGVLLLIVPPGFANPETQSVLRGLGALMAVGIMAGAILSHLFVLGIVVNNDSGVLFTLAIIVFISSLIILISERRSLLKYARSR